LIFDFWCEMRKNQIGEEKMTGDSNWKGEKHTLPL
jgi:hypothetical protein